MWTCVKCSETHDDSFSACWNCGTSKEGTEDANFRPVDGELASEQSYAPHCVCPVCKEPMEFGHVGMSGPEGACLDWTAGPQETDREPPVASELLEAGTFFNSEPKRRAHYCVTCGIVTVECSVFKCTDCGRMVPVVNKTCICGKPRAEKNSTDA